jgi:hypothetical protein
MTDQRTGGRTSSAATSTNLNEVIPAPAEYKEIAGVRIAHQRQLQPAG